MAEKWKNSGVKNLEINDQENNKHNNPKDEKRPLRPIQRVDDYPAKKNGNKETRYNYPYTPSLFRPIPSAHSYFYGESISNWNKAVNDAENLSTVFLP